MKIVYLLGNGFDINLGMKTRYSDFYENYLKKESKNILVQKLKSNIFDNVINWSDLELALGQYTSEFSTLSEFDEVFDDLVNSLCDYLEEQYEKYDFASLDVQKFFKDLCDFDRFLSSADRSELNDYKKTWVSNHKSISLINFNYTGTISKILEDHRPQDPIGIASDGKHLYCKKLFHIHGYTNERTILGVNDLSQVANKKFHDDTDFIEAFLKVESNDRQRHQTDKHCQNLINNADLICIFGCSLGETDKFWWNFIANNLRRGIKVIIFFRTEEQNQRLAYKILRKEREIRNKFLSMSDLSNEEKEKLGQNIYIKINANIFELRKLEQPMVG